MQATFEELEVVLQARPATGVRAPDDEGIEDLKAAIEAPVEELVLMPTRDLIDRAMSAPGCDTLTPVLIDRLERYIDALDDTDDALRDACRNTWARALDHVELH